MRPLCALAGLLLSFASPAQAAQRAVVVGADTGRVGEVRLRFAEADAAKMAAVLAELGGFSSEEVMLMSSPTPKGVRAAILAANLALREDDNSLLVVYAAGHGDSRALHLAHEDLELQELSALVRSSPARVRVLIIDACRAGGAVRLRGARLADEPASFADPFSQRAEGFVVLVSSSADEAAQESDAIQGGFFTHHLASALRGAADENQDGAVDVDEAFRYAYSATVRDSSASRAGTQHPEFRIDVGGRGHAVLSRLKERTQLRIPDGVDALVFRSDATGPLVAELPATARNRVLALRAGGYFVRLRAPDAIYEKAVMLTRQQSASPSLSSYERYAYARYARRGDEAHALWGIWGDAALRACIVSAQGACPALAAGLSVHAPWLDGRLGAFVSRERFENRFLAGTHDIAGATLQVGRVWDVTERFQLGAFAIIDGGVVYQQFLTRGLAPPRLGGFADVGAGGSAGFAFLDGWQMELRGSLVAMTFQSEHGITATPTPAIALGIERVLGP